MPRAKRKTEVEETETEETKPVRRGRRKAATPETKPVRRGRRKAEPEDEVEVEEDEVETKPGRRKAAKPAAKATNGETKPWQEVEVDDEDAITLGDKDPRGAVQVAVVDFMNSRGRKKTTVGMVKTHIVEELERGSGYADYVVRNSIYREVLAS